MSTPIPEQIKKEALRIYSTPQGDPNPETYAYIKGREKGMQEIAILEQTIVDQDKQILEQKQEVKKHVDKFKEILTLIDRYRKEVEITSTGNHVYNEIMQHLILTKNY